MIQIIEYMNENLKLMMWSSSTIDVESVVTDVQKSIKNTPEFEPTPYTFTKLENGKKITANSTSLTPPSWLLLDHSIAIIWLMFSMNPHSHQLSIPDLKWAYQFLKQIKNKKGDNPPDVKVCLREIQDQLIHLYAKQTSLKQEDFDEIAAAFGEKIIEDTTTSYYNTTFTSNRVESKLNMLSLAPRKSLLSPLMHRRSFNDITKDKTSKKVAVNFSNKFPVLEEDFDHLEEPDTGDEEEVEKYLLSIFQDERKESLETKPNAKSLIPKKKSDPALGSEAVSRPNSAVEGPKKEKKSKRVHCVAEMRSLKFHKSMKVQDKNGEEAAYSNLKAEIKRLSFNPNVPKNEIMKFLKDWRSEQVDRLNNELKRLSSIEEFMKSINKEEVEPNLQMNSPLRLKELDTAKTNCSLRKSLLP